MCVCVINFHIARNVSLIFVKKHPDEDIFLYQNRETRSRKSVESSQMIISKLLEKYDYTPRVQIPIRMVLI